MQLSLAMIYNIINVSNKLYWYLIHIFLTFCKGKKKISLVVIDSTRLLGKARIYKKKTVYQHILWVNDLERISHSVGLNYMVEIANLNRYCMLENKSVLHSTFWGCFTLRTIVLMKPFRWCWSLQCIRNTFIIDIDMACIWLFDEIEG